MKHQGDDDNATYFGMHQHNCWQLDMVESGTLEFRCRNQTYLLADEDLLIIPPNQDHTMVLQPDRKVLYISLKFYIHQPPPELSSKIVFIKSGRLTQVMLDILRSAIAEFMQGGQLTTTDWEYPPDSLANAHFLEGVIAAIIGHCALESDAIRHSELLNGVRSRIRYFGGRPVTATDLAREFHYSAGHFAQLIKKATGETVKALIDTERLSIIREILVTSSSTVAQLSADFGFCDSIYFCRYFKQHIGMTPGQYRKTAKHPRAVRRVVRVISAENWETEKNALLATWLDAMGRPAGYRFPPSLETVEEYDFPEGRGRLMRQRSGPDSVRQLLLLTPHRVQSPVPGAVVPFFSPELSFGYDWKSKQPLPPDGGHPLFPRHLLALGLVVAATDSYPLNIIPPPPGCSDPRDLMLWRRAAAALNSRYPEWSGIGKLAFDTRLAVDALLGTGLVDPGRVLAIGHLLGAKTALYAGCLDERIGMMILSNLSLAWDQSDWNAPWYWGERCRKLQDQGIGHHHLLAIAAPKPCLLITDQATHEKNRPYLDEVRKIYDHYGKAELLQFRNHAIAQQPTNAVLLAAYRWLCRQCRLDEPPPDFLDHQNN